MSNTGFKGVDVRQTGSALVFRAFMQTSAGAKETAGPVTLALYEIQNDGTFKSYDFNDNTFKTAALTTATASMTHQKGNNATVNTGVWTYALSTLTGFTVGAIYLAQVNDASASPTDQTREFQYGSEQGDLVVTANGTGVGEINSNAIQVGGANQTGLDLGGTWTAARAAHLDADISSRMATFTLPTNFAALGISAGGHISNVDTLTTYTGNTPQTGDSYARLGAPAGLSIAADIAEIEAETDGIGADTPGTTTLLGRLGQAILFDASGYVKSDVEHWIAVTMNALASGNVQAQVAGYATGQDPWSQLRGAVPGNTPTTGTLEWFFRLLDADPYTTNTGGSPWEIAYMVRGTGAPGTGTQLLLKGLYDTGGNPLTSTTVVVGGAH